MSAPLLATKLFIPPTRPELVPRLRLIERLNAGLHRKLTLISAAAGFGKTTLIAHWAQTLERPLAWLALDADDNNPYRFLSYLVAAVRTAVPDFGGGLLATLQAPQPPPLEPLLPVLINALATLDTPLLLVLDDYHVLEAPPVDALLNSLIDHLPPQCHLVLASREDPPLPLSRLRARNQLSELRAADLRFTPLEAATFLNQRMGLSLDDTAVTALEERTEGWIAGLQLAALALQGAHQRDPAIFIENFSGSHRFVLDYLVEEVLNQQPADVQTFLLETSILERLCGALCDALLETPAGWGQQKLEMLERSNLFTVPLDGERRWYRYHHLFGELLRQRLNQQADQETINQLHQRASQWLEEAGFELAAFQHAAQAQDMPRAVRLLEGEGSWMPLHFRGGVLPVLTWIEHLPSETLDAWPVLRVLYASALLFVARIPEIEPQLQAAERHLDPTDPDPKRRDLIGHIASIRASVGVSQQAAAVIAAQSRRALEFIHPDNLPVRTATIWSLAHAHHLQGDVEKARAGYLEALTFSRPLGHHIITIMATLGLGMLAEDELRLTQAREQYLAVLELVGDPPLPIAAEAYAGLARIHYWRNELEEAHRLATQARPLAEQLATTDRIVRGELLLARIAQARADMSSARAHLTSAARLAHEQGFTQLLPEIAAARLKLALLEGDLAHGAAVLQGQDLPLSDARLALANDDLERAEAALQRWEAMATRQPAAHQIEGELLQVLLAAERGDLARGHSLLDAVLTQAAGEGLIRPFINEGTSLLRLLQAPGKSQFAGEILAAFDGKDASASLVPAHLLVDPLSERELEVLALVAQGLSNREIGERLFLALSTVKGHNRRIYDKLQVQRRTEAVARARELGLI